MAVLSPTPEEIPGESAFGDGLRRVPSEDKSMWTFADLGARFLLTVFFGFEDLLYKNVD